ncbi:hypothetical protein HYD46_00805 [Mycoplasmopsis bovis]|nr:hypothetical protein [Mycoplasmopsis bovis]QQH78150.1 hypothetical protein HYD46_00805 [Mycoplasmopsis bovis]
MLIIGKSENNKVKTLMKKIRNKYDKHKEDNQKDNTLDIRSHLIYIIIKTRKYQKEKKRDKQNNET